MHPDHDLDANPGASSDEPTKQDPGAEVTGGARAAEDAIHRLARLTLDPAIAIDTARLHLDAVREPAIDLYRRLDAAHNETAHISATPRGDELDESQPSAPGARHRHPEDHQRPGAGDHRPGPAR